jgi:hypothetical protein
MKACKLLLAAGSAAILLSALASSASGRNLSVDNQSLRATFREVSFHLPTSTVTCEVIIEGSLHRRTIAKVLSSLIGYITSATLGPCQGGTASIQLLTLPWHVRYSGFQGVLPNITSVITHVIEMGVRIGEPGGLACLIRSSAAEPVIRTYHRDASNHLRVGLSGRLTSAAECFGARISIASDSPQVVLSNTSTAISLTLI